MADIIYRPYQKKDEKTVVDICYKTGYMGEDCTGKFGDRVLFGYLFCLYYLRYEPETCFVAVNTETNTVVGYIIGTVNAAGYKYAFSKSMIPKIILRLMLLTSWRYNKDFRQVLHWNKIQQSDKESLPNGLYTAHLHINVLPGYQRHGIGRNLIQVFEDALKARNVQGVYLETSNYNFKALEFYKKNGFVVHEEVQTDSWFDVADHKKVAFTKKIQ